MSLLEVQNLSVRFGRQEAVKDVSFSLAAGERLGIVGESGSGKTLTSLAIAGLLPEGAIISGTITLNGEPLPTGEREMARLRGQRFGLVFQEPMTALNPLMSISRQIDEAVALRGEILNRPAAITALLEEVGLQPEHGRRYPHQLSGGQRQRAMIAMALANRPDILIADEQTSALDLVTQRKVLDLIAAVCAKRHMALLFISHDLKAVAALCSRAAVLEKGVLVELASTADLFSAPQAPYTQKLVAASQSLPLQPQQPELGSLILQAKGITRDYGSRGLFGWGRKPLRAVDGVDFQIRSGECLAIVGPSGCGKTTLARIVAGLDRASAGELKFRGARYHGNDLPTEQRQHISLVFQDPFGSFDPRQTIGNSLAEPLRLDRKLPARERQNRVTEMVEAVGLDRAMLERYPHEFSGGQRQRFAIARALVTRPRLLVLDEPVSALDMPVRGDVLSLLSRLQSEFGLTYLMISHDLDMVAAMANHVLVMEAGHILEVGTPEALFARPRHRLTRDLVAARLPALGVSKS